MTLTNPKHKLQASMAVFEFSNKELIYLQNNLDWGWLRDLPDATAKDSNQVDKIMIGLRIASLAYHTEIMNQSLFEYQNKMSTHLPLKQKKYLEEIFDFLNLLRNSLSHTEGQLAPRWHINRAKTKKEKLVRLDKLVVTGFSVSIPCTKEENGYRFCEKSSHLKKIKFSIKLNKYIKLDTAFISKLRLLSWHILTITKKLNPDTLQKYLGHVLTPGKKRFK